MESYKDKLEKMSKPQFEAEMKKYFNGSATKSTEKHAKDCVHYGKFKGECVALDRADCLGCSFYRTEEVEE